MSGELSKFWSEIVSGYREGCEERKAAIRSEREKNSPTERIVEGVAKGMMQASLNPINWLFSIISK